ncbi:MAG: hypothetical protein HY296_00790 [Thaumarchaeota archaeon]|nr:hypothetical protein [Nitrososphaerota archaeon]
MKVLVAGFITIDSIQLPVRRITSVGGPPCYAGLICSRFGLEVTPLTKVGTDFPDEQAMWLSRNGIAIGAGDRSLSKPTTRFGIERSGEARTLTLLSRCEDISKRQLKDVRYDASLVSPIAGEVSPELLTEVSARSDFTFLDPQGFVRRFDSAGRAAIGELVDKSILPKVDALKMDREEAAALTGKSVPKEALQSLASIGVRKALVTSGSGTCHVLDGGRIYSVSVPQVQVVDSTGAGDIMAGTIVAIYLKTRDFLWSACFGIAASSLSLHLIALAKVDLPMTVDEQAKRLYSLANPVAAV